MITKRILAAMMLLTFLMIFGHAFAQNPIKWSAPMNEYPTPWYPTAPPPSYYNPYGYYQNPYGYGYGGYGGYQGGYQNYGFSGNPYYYYYGQ